MAKKNLKKVLRHIYAQNPNFDPADYTINWDAARKYIIDKDKRMTYNNHFKPLFKQFYKESVQNYLNAGYKMTYELKKGFKANAKEQAKEYIQAEDQTILADKQSSQEQKTIFT